MCSQSNPNSTTESIPYGYCHCGCGEKTRLSKRSIPAYGYAKGRPARFIVGHNRRNPPPTTGRKPFYKDGVWLVPLPHGEFSKIDEGDVASVGDHIWHNNGQGYAVSVVDGAKMRLHRFIMDPPKGVDVDHINGDRLDNRRSNLRLCNQSQNTSNTGLSPRNTSGYKGVTWDKQRNKWAAAIKKGKLVHLGYFDSPIDAARMYDLAAMELHGEFARINFELVGYG